MMDSLAPARLPMFIMVKVGEETELRPVPIVPGRSGVHSSTPRHFMMQRPMLLPREPGGLDGLFVVDLRIGDRSLFKMPGRIPAERFGEGWFSDPFNEPVEPMQWLVIEFENDRGAPVEVNGYWEGIEIHDAAGVR
jgi:hypothetical protein